MSSPWSLDRDVSAETSRQNIERARDELIAGNNEDVRLQNVRSLVLDSWHRSLDAIVGLEGLPPIEFDAEALEAYRRDHPLAGAIDVVRSLLLPGGSGGSGVVVGVGDAAGRILWVEGDREVRGRADAVGFIPGTNWSEGVIGTTAPGTALAVGRSVQIRDAEHFNRLVQPWSCTAAPVLDPETGQVLGVIDVTGGSEVVTPQAKLLVDATARAIEGQLLVSRLRARSEPLPKRRDVRRVETVRATLRVMNRDRALLEVSSENTQTVTEIGARHAEILLMLAVHREGLSAERLGELVYGEASAVDTLRPELVRLRKVLERLAPQLVPASRPYRLTATLETDAHQLLSLLDRGAHRVALASFAGDVLPHSTAPGVEEFRDDVRMTLRDALMAEGSVDVLLAFAETQTGSTDTELLRQCLSMLPPRSPRRAGLVTRIERIEAMA